MKFNVIDKYGGILSTDSSSKLYLSSIAPQRGTLYPSTIESETSINCVNGTFVIDNFIFIGQPNSTRSKSFHS